MSASTPERKHQMALRPIPVPEPWTAAIIPASAFPIPEPERAELQSALRTWCSRLAAVNKLIPATWLQMNSLHLDNGAKKLSANGRAWLPVTGLGVYPDREPPRLWTSDDFQNREFGQPAPPLMHTVFHISGGDKASDHARDLMVGSGTVMYALLRKPIAEYHTVMQNLLLPRITEEALRGHPFYIPLITADSIRDIPIRVLESWMGSARLYVRESLEDRGLLVIANIPQSLETLFPSPEQLPDHQG